MNSIAATGGLWLASRVRKPRAKEERRDIVNDTVTDVVALTKVFRTIALIVVAGAVALTVFLSEFSPLRLFPKQPKLADVQRERLVAAVKQFRSPV